MYRHCFSFKLLFLLLLCAGGVSAQVLFENVNRTAYVSVGHQAEFFYYVTGQAWGDINNDGWQDLYVTNSGGDNKLFLNNGDGTFRQYLILSSITLRNAISGGAVFADYNNDGRQDLYVLNYGPNSLFRNTGNGFSPVAASLGVDDPGKGQTAAWGDFDNDGDLDLYVTNWECPDCSHEGGFAGNRDRLYRNDGAAGFSDVSHFLGFPNLEGAGFAASFLDFDNDGDLDIYVVNDAFANPIGNRLFRNDGPGCEGWCFSEISDESGSRMVINGMGLAVGDYDNDGDLDMFMSNMGLPVLLENQMNSGSPAFRNVTLSSLSELDDEHISWGTFFFDYNNDRWADIFLAGGQIDSLTDMYSKLYRNDGSGIFDDISAGSGLADPLRTIGSAYADYDRDGRIDLVAGNRGSGYKLFKNRSKAARENRWLSVLLSGAWPVNRNAIGSRVYLYLEDGSILMQEVKSGSSHGAGNQLAVHFGLANQRIDSLRVVWPDDRRVVFDVVPANHHLHISYPDQMVIAAILRRGWQPFAMPVETGGRPFGEAFDERLDSLLSFEGQFRLQTLPSDSQGYWLRASDPLVFELQGEPILQREINLQAGWNLIPGLSREIDVAAVDDPDGIIIPGSWYGYRGGYYPADKILAGRSFWVRASAAGTIFLNVDAEPGPGENRPDLANASMLLIEDDAGNYQQLYFEVNFEGRFPRDYFQLPPAPPGNTFDIRFSDGYRASDRPEMTIELTLPDAPLYISSPQLVDASGQDYFLTLQKGETVLLQRLLSTSAAPLKIFTHDFDRLKIKVSPKVADFFILERNFPNPFNPVTNIRFTVLNPGFVELAVFDVLGRKVRSMLAQEFAANSYRAIWDGRDDAGLRMPSGLYFYRMTSGNQQETRKMLLVR